jgi:hypothetical protein
MTKALGEVLEKKWPLPIGTDPESRGRSWLNSTGGRRVWKQKEMAREVAGQGWCGCCWLDA